MLNTSNISADIFDRDFKTRKLYLVQKKKKKKIHFQIYALFVSRKFWKYGFAPDLLHSLIDKWKGRNTELFDYALFLALSIVVIQIMCVKKREASKTYYSHKILE